MLQKQPEPGVSLIPFVEGSFPITIAWQYLKLEAQAAAEEAIGRHEDDPAVVGGKSHVALREQVAAIGQDFGVTGNEPGQALTNLDTQVRIDVVRGVAVGGVRGERGSTEPFIAGDDLGGSGGNGSGKTGGRAGAIL